MTMVNAAFPALMCFMIFTSSVIAVQQSWGDFAMPQRQTDVAKTGLQAGNFNAFTDGVVRETVTTIQDLAFVPYTVEDIGSGQLCPNTTAEIFGFYGAGLVQDDDLNLYATFSMVLVPGPPPPLSWTVKLSRGVDDEFIPQWVTCTSADDSGVISLPSRPALYKDANEDTFVIFRLSSTQIALRASDGALEHSMEGSLGRSAALAITPDGVVLQPGGGVNDTYIASTDEPLSGTTFTLTTDQGLSPPTDVLRTMGSPNSFVGFDEEEVAFFDNLGQTSATTLLNTSFGDIVKISGLKDGRVVVLHLNQSEATLTTVDYDGTNRVDIVLDSYGGEPDDPYSENVCEGADGHVYVQDFECNLYRVDIASSSTEKINYTGIGQCFIGSNLAANEEGVFFVTSNDSIYKRGPPTPTANTFAEFNGLQYGNSAIEQLGNRISLQQPGSAIFYGALVPGAQFGLVVSSISSPNGINFSVPQPMIVAAAFNVEEVSSESADSDSDAASGLSSIFSGVF